MFLNRKNNLLLTSLLVSGVLAAQETTTGTLPAAPVSSPDNSMLYLMLSGAAILLVVIFISGNVLVSLTKLALDKRKTLSVLLMLLATNFLFAQDAAPVVNQPAPTSSGFFSNINLVAGAVVIITELMVLLWMLLRMRALLVEISGEKKEARELVIHLPQLFDNFNASVAIEKETDILLDHNYDGIRELDNALPPWWKYSFYITIVWAFFYLGYYYIGGGPSSLDEYNTEVKLAQAEVDAFNKKNALNVDESNVPLADAAGVLDGMEIFKTNCVACHGSMGEGNGVGPNLTDAYWLHGGTLNDVFKTVKYGWPAKGMKSWQTDLSSVQIKNVVGYIHSLQGSNPPNAKAPQGDLTTAVVAPTDSTVVAITDSLKK